MKPLVRWTYGGRGGNVLRHSIRLWKSMYADIFDLCVCYNNCPPPPVAVTLIDQRQYLDSLPLRPFGPAWKLYPPRLRPEAHEVVIDNDLVLYSPLPLLNEFLAGSFLMISEAKEARPYGVFEPFVPPDVSLNSGFLGLPPGFDFKQVLTDRIRASGINKFQRHLDEQGLVAWVFAETQNYRVVPLTDINVQLDDYRFGRCGVHFVGLNGGKRDHWRNYLSRTLF